MRSASGWRRNASTFATTTPSIGAPTVSMPSTARPRSFIVSASAADIVAQRRELIQPRQQHLHQNCSRNRSRSYTSRGGRRDRGGTAASDRCRTRTRSLTTPPDRARSSPARWGGPCRSHRARATTPSGRWISNSADGSVNGKYDGRRRLVNSEPKYALVNASIVPARSPNVMPRSTTSPSIWWNTGMCVASAVSRRKTRPGHDRVDRRRPVVSITRICTGDVCVRSTTVPGSPQIDVEGVPHARAPGATAAC